jgi:hypothetical protein
VLVTTKAWITDADGAAEGDYVLRRKGDEIEVGRVAGGDVAWTSMIPASALPDLEDADQERLLVAARGVETALHNRGG